MVNVNVHNRYTWCAPLAFPSTTTTTTTTITTTLIVIVGRTDGTSGDRVITNAGIAPGPATVLVTRIRLKLEYILKNELLMSVWTRRYPNWYYKPYYKFSYSIIHKNSIQRTYRCDGHGVEETEA